MWKWLCFFLSVSLSAFSQTVIEGVVVDKESGKPIPFASIGIVGKALGTSSNADGQFSLAVSGDITLKITCVGYESVTITASPQMGSIQLQPIATQLKEVVVFDREINPTKIVRKAFAGVSRNFENSSFFQSFFYRHYCKDEENYGRLIEAFVEVWKQNGYGSFRGGAGQHEALRLVQLRRSLDRTAIAQSHEPISIAGALQTDLMAYQTAEESERFDFYSGLSNLRMDFEDYEFTFAGLTNYDGTEVYEITYQFRPNEVGGNENHHRQGLSGTLFITTDTHAIVRAEELRYKGGDSLRTAAFYRNYNGKYFPYRLIRDGGTFSGGKRVHWFHIDLMSVEISQAIEKKFHGDLPKKEELLAIDYDSAYWNHQTILKATPLENEIVRDLGGGKSLNQQFYNYRQYELNTHNGGIDAVKKLNWLIDYTRESRPLFVCFWSPDCASYLTELEQFKRLNTKYRESVTFAMVSLDDDDARWNQFVQRFNFSADGIMQYRIGGNSETLKKFQIRETPSFLLFPTPGAGSETILRQPSIRLLEENLKSLLQNH
jgi:hypothetical protein